MSGTTGIRRLLIANRGEIAVRIARTARRMGVETVAIYADADAGAPHVRAADLAVRVGESAPHASYANAEAVLAALRSTGADALHPGYGFLAENAEFAEACGEAGARFVGPSPATMRALGDKSAAKRLLAATSVPLLPGYDGSDQRDETLRAAARDLGAPLMIKATAGGGGRGMRLVSDFTEFETALAAARSEALATFGSADVLLERALIAPRHIEVQIFGDRFGDVVHLGERDCSVQRRHQKLIEESPSPFAGGALRERLAAAALAAGRATGYENAGTVEFLVDAGGSFFFIEVNARLQVEHPVTEAVTGIDLVEWQLRVAAGEPLPLRQDEIRFEGHAIEARLCAEDAHHDFLPQAGTLARWQPPPRCRVDHALESGIVVSPSYDSMIAKLVACGATRDEARRALIAALERTVALGIETNRDALLQILRSDPFARGEATTATLAALGAFQPARPGRDIAIGAALRYRELASGGRFGEWAGWSSTAHPGTAMRLAPRSGGEPVALRVEGPPEAPVVTSGADRYAVAFAAAPHDRTSSVRVAVDGGPWQERAYCVTPDGVESSDAERTVAYVDRSLETSAVSGAAALDGRLRAPMSGRVVHIDAVPGVPAEAGAALIVLEAMKMEHHLTLASGVTVESVDVASGAQVDAGQILLTYRANDSPRSTAYGPDRL